MHHPRGLLLLPLLMLALASCQKREEVVAPSEPVVQETPPAPVVVQEFLALKTSMQAWERIAPDCRKKDCARLAVSLVQFPDKTDLSSLVQKNLLALAEAGNPARGESLQAFADNFLKKSSHGHVASLHATLLRQQDALVAVQLDADFYTGGAHGSPSTRYLNYDRHAERLLVLDDVIVDGRRPAFVQAEKEAYLAWMKGRGTDSSSQWPFRENDNFTLDAEGVRVKYQAYDIGPYSAGQPELLIPYAVLKGILKPEWTLPTP